MEFKIVLEDGGVINEAPSSPASNPQPATTHTTSALEDARHRMGTSFLSEMATP